MKRSLPITTLFVDVGGVLLTNGWDYHERKGAANHFKHNWAEMDERHGLVFETREEGKLFFDEYLGWVVFFEKRPFTQNQFRDFMFSQSKPYPKMLDLVAQLKTQHGFKIVVISNESRNVNTYRVRTFMLDRLALDLAQTAPERAVFIDNTPMFVEIAERLGMQGLHHVDYKSTCAKLASLGLQTSEANLDV